VSVDMDEVGGMVAYSDLLCVFVVHCIWRHCLPIQWTTHTHNWWWILCDPKHVGALL